MSAISLHARASADFDAKLAHSLDLLRQAEARHSPLTQASSLGAEDMVITQLMKEAGIRASIFVLDTGKLHAETLGLLATLRQAYDFPVEVYRPEPAAAEAYVKRFGEEAMYQSIELRKQCCGIRKMEPLARALAGKKGWLTGLRREQSDARADVPDIEQQEERAKINPLAAWTWGDVWHYIATREVPYNPLHDQFFPSIGCAPCTRAISLGEDFRSGRWWWEQESAKECGLHVQPSSALSSIPIREIAA
jgi:phosphoadenosine phosphosulfate reductase